MLDFNHPMACSLKQALRANAIFSACSGLFIVAAHERVLQWLGVQGVSIRVLGAGLLLFSGYLLWMTSRVRVQRAMVSGVIAGDWAWVAGSVALVLTKGEAFSTFGKFLVLDVALLVMGFAIWQQRGLARLVAAEN